MTKTAKDLRPISEQLLALDAGFASVPVERDTGPVPDGRWQGTITRAILTRATSSRPMIEWELTVTTDGKHVDKTIVVRWVITDKTILWIKPALHTLGLDLEKISTVADHLPQLVNALVDFTIRTKEEQRNVYFNRRLDGGPAAGTVADGKTIIEQFPVS